MPDRDPRPSPDPGGPRGTVPTHDAPGCTREKPLPTSAPDQGSAPADSKKPPDPTLDPALLPIGDPAGAA